MACLNPDGTLTSSAQAILKAPEDAPATVAEIAQQARLPLYRVRSSLRELVQAGMYIFVYHCVRDERVSAFWGGEVVHT